MNPDRKAGMTAPPVRCTLCPRCCHADRTASAGFCGGGPKVRVARAMLHQWEEPPLVGKNGAGAVFFSGCPLGCVFCQNAAVSHGNYGVTLEDGELCAVFRRLCGAGCATLDLVSPTQYLPWIADALDELRHTFPGRVPPIVYNTGGYERAETLRRYEGCFDIYLPDLKYVSPELSRRYSGAADYFETALPALREMVRQTGPCVMGEDGVLQRGTIIRHLLLPGARRDTEAVLRTVAAEFGDSVLVSVMRQYTPPSAPVGGCPELSRRICTYEYEKALELCDALGLKGFMQEKSSASREYTPEFNGDLFEN